MKLEEFYNYKNTLIKDLLTNERIVHLLNEKVSMDKAQTLVYQQVFPLEYVPDTVEHGETYICIDVDIQRSVNKTYLLPTIYVWVFTHRSKLRLSEGGIRTDKLCSEIAETINGSRYYGIGELELYSVKRFAPMTDFQGKIMTFTTKEYNRLHDPKKPAPSNRKTGQ